MRSIVQLGDGELRSRGVQRLAFHQLNEHLEPTNRCRFGKQMYRVMIHFASLVLSRRRWRPATHWER